jgi:hypothetical protein
MIRFVVAVMLVAALGTPLAARAQSGPDGGPPPAMRAKMDALRSQAKTDAYAALSADHRARVDAIVAQVAAGTLDPRDAGKQIDALLAPDETTAVVAVAEQSRKAMRATFGDMRGGPPPGGPPPGAPEAGPPRGHHAPSAGRFLIMVSLTPDQMRALRDHQSVPPPTKT